MQIMLPRESALRNNLRNAAAALKTAKATGSSRVAELTLEVRSFKRMIAREFGA